VGGLYIGPYVVLALFIGAVVGSIASVAIGRGEGARRVIPFGPFLAIGIVVTALAGPGMFAWYLSLM
jgi:leader peptidase (prepilin peptidase) / N-methyltransferase